MNIAIGWLGTPVWAQQQQVVLTFRSIGDLGSLADRRLFWRLSGDRGLHGLARAEGRRPIPGSNRAQSRWPARFAPADRRRDQAAHQGRSRSAHGRSLGPSGGAGAGDHVGLSGDRRDPVRHQHGSGEPSVRDGLPGRRLEHQPAGDLPGGVVEPKQILVARSHAVGRPARVLRSAPGLIDDSGRALGGQSEPGHDVRHARWNSAGSSCRRRACWRS